MESFLSFNSTENFRKKLISRNLKPYKVDESFNSDGFIREVILQDYAVTDNSDVTEQAKILEPRLIGLNKYTPVGGFGETVIINKNFGSEANAGNYPFQNLKNTSLELIGNQKESFLYTKNIYGPVLFGTTYGSSVDINKDRQVITNKGNYNYNSTFKSKLEVEGNNKEIELRVLNKYDPEDVPIGYGDSVVFETFSLGSNFGEYDYVSNGPNRTTSQSQVQSYLLNKYGPKNQTNGFGVEKEPNVWDQTMSNLGEYVFFTSQPNKTLEQSRIEAFVSNKYGPVLLPNGYGNTEVDPFIDKPNIPNQGQYPFFTSAPPKTNQQQQTAAYIKNVYNTGEGSYELVTIDDLIQETRSLPYLNSDSTFIFIKSDYTPIEILTKENPQGSDGSLSQDSVLAQLSAKKLKSEYETRIAYNLLKETYGKSNLTNSVIQPNTGTISVSPKEDPFLALGVVAGTVPIINKDYSITSPPQALGGASLSLFEQSLAGVYLPVSPILGEYFDYPQKNFLLQAIDNPVALAAGSIANLATKIITPLIDSSSELFLSYTSAPTKQLLFSQLFYNQYRPQYRADSLLSPNLLAPKSSFYVGTTKNFIRDAVSPKTDIALGKFGKTNDGPVFSYSEIGKEYEGKKVTDLLFGFNSKPFYDSVGLQGGFTWMSKNNFFQPGKLVGVEGKKFGQSVALDQPTLSELNKTNSSNQSFTDGSILDITQKLVDAGNKSTRKLEHVGNAINQITKVFNDGYNELTKGSKVIRYQTPTSKNSQVSDVVGYEYCRLFTKDMPYSKFFNAQKSGGASRFDNASVAKTLEKVGGTYSILDSPANLNIAPMNGQGSTNFRNGKVKKYMFSIENLAWRTSNRVGYRVEDLPACEIGPNGGRVMWFPPYDLSFDETSRAKFQGHEFIGRTEPIYTYQGAERTGSISFKIVVDHPSVLNTIVKKELAKVDNQTTTKIVDSFFAGCLKYDPYDLLKKYRSSTLTLSDIFEAQNALTANVTLEQYKDLNGNLPDGRPQNTVTTNNTTNGNVSNSGTTGTPTNTLALTADEERKFEEIALFFDFNNTYPVDFAYSEYITKLSSVSFLNNFSDEVYSYNNRQDILSGNKLQNFSLSDYVDARTQSIGFFDGFVKSEKVDYDDFKTKLLELLKSGAKVSFDIFSEYSSIIDDIVVNIEDEGDGEKSIKDYIDDGFLTINTKFVPTKSIDTTYRDIDCTKQIPNFQSEGIYTLQARFCNSAFIRNVKVENNPNSTSNQSTTNQGGSEGAYDPNAGEDGRDPNLQQRPDFQTENITTLLPESKLRQKVTKKLLRNLFSECTYFDMIKDSDPFIYDGIKEKIKHFHPSFHSTTPEGLNSRLTFLQQCMLPGDTIPTAVQVGSTTTLAYNDVYNSAFGSPPILVLRVGDFFHTKIVPESLTLKYQDAKFDLNPEGIGVQPMIAEVTLSFKFIGGHGLAEPVAKLNNALSFNFYANTEIYDERAEETFDFTSILDSQLIQDVNDEVGLIKPGTDTDANDSGNPIGTTENTYFDSNVNTIVGQINYKNKMNDLSDKTKVMVSGIKNQLVELFDWRGYGANLLFTYNRKFKDGYTNYFNNSTKFDTEIFGKPDTYAETLRNVFEQTKKDIDDGLCPLFGGKPDNIKDNDFRKIKNNLKQILDDELTLWAQKFDSAASYLAGQNATDFIQILDQMNFVLNNVDGYKNKAGTYVLYNISGTTEVAPPTTTGTTYDELLKDVTKIALDLNYLFIILEDSSLIPSAQYEFKEDYSFEIESDITLPEEKRFYIIFSKTFSDENKFKEFFNKLINGVTGQNDIRNVKNWILSQSGYFESNGNYVKNNNYDSLSYLYSTDDNSDKEGIETFKTLAYNPRFENYKPYEKNKIRRFTLSKQTTIDQQQLKNFQDLWSTNNLESVYFNLKKKLN